ncbi:SDR family oxidoreductase [Roseomonas xinghualingensis]|uniref:SDR family oxidoreductase n=1 Tax=Roseomonas xinghualingensis TaxID=2986475 RepID=UPI0021F24A5A|nr:SDR family oxidoreductase [Roseomonas sp. SXEYE001]MCV4210168.1 SDR family oxidoreductase [Roseomonas sp. SXEYE001]
MGRLDDRAVAVTGAAQGGGAAIDQRFLAEDARLSIIDEPEQMTGLAPRPEVRNFVADLSAPGAGEVAARAALDACGRVDTLVNNAGTGGSKSLVESDDALNDRFIDTNRRSVLHVTRAIPPRLSRPGGRIINIHLTLSLAGYSGTTAWGFTCQMAADLGPEGVPVNTIVSGVTGEADD